MTSALRRARHATRPVVVPLLALMIAGCTSEDVGDDDKSGTGATSGVGAAAAGGSAPIDTAGTRVNTSPAGAIAAPGAAGATTGATAAAKSKGTRP